MAYVETVLRVFLASPSDLSDERIKIEEIIQDVNATVGKACSIRIELVTWENSTSPSIGVEPQAVINRQINDKYDIFLGLMWSRFGSSTHSYSSGTEEEFYRAKERFDNKEGIFDIMFYFKNEPIPPLSIDTVQVQKIQDFRKKLGEEGVYYWNFTSIDSFERNFRIHISNKIYDFTNISQINEQNISKQIFNKEGEKEEFEPGIYDVVEIIENELSSVNSIVNNLTECTVWISERLNHHTEQTNLINGLNSGNPPRSASIKILDSAADDIETFSIKIKENRTNLTKSLNLFIKNTVEICALAKEYGWYETIEYSNFIYQLRIFNASFSNAHINLNEFINTIKDMPRITARLNLSRKHAAHECTVMAEEMKQSIDLLNELLDKHSHI